MKPRINLQHSLLLDLVRPRAAPRVVPFCIRVRPQRHASSNDGPLPQAGNEKPGPNQEQLPHVSEEAAATSKIQGDAGPDLDQGTPVGEVS